MESVDRIVKSGVAFASALLYLILLSVWGVVTLRGFRTAIKAHALFVSHPEFYVGGRSLLMLACLLPTVMVQVISSDSMSSSLTSATLSVLSNDSTLWNMLLASVVSCILLDVFVGVLVYGPQNRLFPGVRFHPRRALQSAEILRYFIGANLITLTVLICVGLFVLTAVDSFNNIGFVLLGMVVAVIAIAVIVYVTLFRTFMTLVQVRELPARAPWPRRLLYAMARSFTPIVLVAVFASGVAAQAHMVGLLFPSHNEGAVQLISARCEVSDSGRIEITELYMNSSEHWYYDARDTVAVQIAPDGAPGASLKPAFSLSVRRGDIATIGPKTTAKVLWRVPIAGSAAIAAALPNRSFSCKTSDSALWNKLNDDPDKP